VRAAKQERIKGPKVFGCAQIISLLNIEQCCGWVDVDLSLASSPCLTLSSAISVVEALMKGKCACRTSLYDRLYKEAFIHWM
jgi:hypothetical protein